MTTKPTTPALHAGAPCLILAGRRSDYTGTSTIIERETKTQWITEAGRRFRKEDGEEVGYRSAEISYATAPRLIHVDSPDGLEARRRAKLGASFGRTLDAVRAWERDRDNLKAIAAARAALADHAHVVTDNPEGGTK